MRSIPVVEARTADAAAAAGAPPSLEAMPTAAPVLTVESLSVSYPAVAGEGTTAAGVRFAVRDLSLTVAPEECLGVVGESGAGKSQAFLAVMGLTPPAARVSGRIRLVDVDLGGLPPARWSRLRGARMAMIFQDHSSSLTPHLTIGDQIAEPIVRHRGASWRAARARALELLERVQMNDPARRLRQYPHELSGGMRQRAMIAIALACGPSLLIADEPTTALDVTVQAQILALLASLKREERLSIVLITHDFGVIAGLADRVAVMQGGRKVEEGDVRQIFAAPEHPHTRALLAAARGGTAPAGGDSCAPVVGDSRAPVVGDSSRARARPDSSIPGAGPTLRVARLSVDYPLRRLPAGMPGAKGARRGGTRARSRPRALRAIDDVSFELRAGEALGIVGESGCGKSTLVRAVLRLLRPAAGTVVWAGRALETLDRHEMRGLRADLQIVFQDPLGSLDPHLTAGESVAEPLAIHRPDLTPAERTRAVLSMLERVGLAPETARRLPHELSGGQCQRVGIARAMILAPKLLVCDEPVSALDASLRDEMVGLIAALQREHGTSILFVSHDLEVVRRLCERVLVLYLGRAMELAPADLLHARPLHPYTQALLAAVPVADPAIQAERLRRMAERSRGLPSMGDPLLPSDAPPGDALPAADPLSPRDPPSLGQPPALRQPPSPTAPPPGCAFRARCPHAVARCITEVPSWEPAGDDRWVACHRWRDTTAGTIAQATADPVRKTVPTRPPNTPPTQAPT